MSRSSRGSLVHMSSAMARTATAVGDCRGADMAFCEAQSRGQEAVTVKCRAVVARYRCIGERRRKRLQRGTRCVTVSEFECGAFISSSSPPKGPITVVPGGRCIRIRVVLRRRRTKCATYVFRIQCYANKYFTPLDDLQTPDHES